jgi:hypothetical protein
MGALIPLKGEKFSRGKSNSRPQGTFAAQEWEFSILISVLLVIIRVGVFKLIGEIVDIVSFSKIAADRIGG